MSCHNGWAEDNFKRYGIDFVRVQGKELGTSITAGVVLDAYGRSYYSMDQINKMILRIRNGDVRDDDVIYTEDFWQPGIEALFYIRHITNKKFKIGCFFHAQTVDTTDFTYPMRQWMRPIEKGMVKAYDYIFVTSHILKELMQKGYESVCGNVHVIGLPYNSKCLLNQLGYKGEMWNKAKKESFVLFSSRFDREKNPHFFMDLVEACPDIQFKVVKPRENVSNDLEVAERLQRLLTHSKNLEQVDTANKQDYYQLLERAKVQFNCAKQDWVSWTILEAITFGCNPLYPIWKDFPWVLKGYNDHLYTAWSLSGASKKLRELLQKPFDPTLLSIVDHHDLSWRMYLECMGFDV
jgi:glycosyltransferase involved in cell wall biosynthesis